MSEAANRIRNSMRQLAKQVTPDEALADLVYGHVLQIDPLRVHIENKFMLEPGQVILSRLCKPLTVEGIEVWRGIETGDTLTMLRVGKGRLYYALEHTGGDDDT